jgi:hypothetical protein
MNDAPFFQTVKDDAGVQAIFGTNPCRIFPFGYTQTKGDKVTKPYAVFQQVGGSPDNNLSDRPKSDEIEIQVDVYAPKVADVKAAANAIETAIELDCHVVKIMGAVIEPETKLYRSTFLTQWRVNR